MSRHRNRAEDVPHHGVGVESLGFGVEREHDAVAHHIGCQVLDVFRCHEVALPEKRACPRGLGEGDQARGDAPYAIIGSSAPRPIAAGSRVARTRSTM